MSECMCARLVAGGWSTSFQNKTKVTRMGEVRVHAMFVVKDVNLFLEASKDMIEKTQVTTQG